MDAIDKYDKRAEAIRSLLCVGLDPDIRKLPERFKTLEYPQYEFNKWIIDETNTYAAAYKPNSAFYESRGDKGIRELKMTFEYLQERHPEIYTILDAKRADIGNTNEQYASFAFDWLQADAMTVQPYLGGEALSPFFSRKDKGIFVLCRNSSERSGELQDLLVDMEPLWKVVARQAVEKWNENGNCMLVMSALHPEELAQVRTIVKGMTLLVPGVGAQGGTIEEVIRNGKNGNGRGLIINSSRGIIFSDDPKEEAKLLRDRIHECLHGETS